MPTPEQYNPNDFHTFTPQYEQEEEENNEVDSIEHDRVSKPDVIIEEPTDNPVETPTVTEPSKSEHKSSNATNAVPPPPNARVKKSFEKPSNK